MPYFFLMVFTIVVIGNQSLTCSAADDRKELTVFLNSTISRLKAEKRAAHGTEHHSFNAAIEELVRLRDHKSWPVINSPIAISRLQNSSWELKPDDNGFRQRINFGGVCSSWARSKRTLPMSFSWNTESNRIRLSYSSDYRKSGNYEIIEKTYTYKIKGDKLLMKSGDEILEWHHKVKK